MDFKATRPDVVRAINQRWLLKFWQRHQETGKIPQWQAAEAENLTRAGCLSVLDVVGTAEAPRFQIRSHGERIARVYGSQDCRGRFLDEVILAKNHPTGLAPYFQSLRSARPVYTIHDVRDRNGLVIHFERLLLPFSQGGDGVDRILASFEFICEDGAFDEQALMTTQSVPPALRLSATIESLA
jgi:hypothetical protein